MNKRQATLTIQTPEGITFPLVLADPVVRFLALAIDSSKRIISPLILSGLALPTLALLGLWVAPEFMIVAAGVLAAWIMAWIIRPDLAGQK